MWHKYGTGWCVNISKQENKMSYICPTTFIHVYIIVWQTMCVCATVYLKKGAYNLVTFYIYMCASCNSKDYFFIAEN